MKPRAHSCGQPSLKVRAPKGRTCKCQGGNRYHKEGSRQGNPLIYSVILGGKGEIHLFYVTISKALNRFKT